MIKPGRARCCMALSGLSQLNDQHNTIQSELKKLPKPSMNLPSPIVLITNYQKGEQGK